MSLLPTLALLAAALGGGPAEAGWGDVELPRGFSLELASGEVTSRPDAPALRYEEGRLRADAAAGLALYRLAPRPEGGPRRRLERGEGEPRPELAAEPGLELACVAESGWAYLRVLEAEPARLRLELASAPSEAPGLERDPPELRARSLQAAVELEWDASPGALYRVERRALAPGAPWQPLAELEGGAHADATAAGGRLVEYRVARADAPAFGARARAVPGLLPEDQAVELARGQALNLFTGEDDPTGAHLTVEFVGNKGAQLACGPGVEMRTLTPIEHLDFELPAREEGGYRDQRLFVGPDRVLAVRLPEGLYARVRLEPGEGSEVYLHRQLDLEGGRVFPPAPLAPIASWEGELGVAVAPPAAPLRGPEDRPLAYVLEREERYRAEDWRAVGRLELEGEPLLDQPPATRGLVRYRLRYALGDGRRSLPGPVGSVLIGDDGGAGSEALLAEALDDLGHPDFERRTRAEGVLAALGRRAAGPVRARLESDDPEVVAAARRVIVRLGPLEPGGEDVADGAAGTGELAPVLLAARARAKGLGAPPPGWIAAEPGERALALLRQLGPAREPALDPWRELLAADDPDPALRLLAGAVGSWAASRRPLGPGFEPEPGAPAARFDLSGLVLGLYGDAAARRALAARLDPSRPWQAYVELQVLHELERAARAPLGEAGLDGGRAALERAALAASLLERDTGGRETEAFLAAALEVVDDPSVRLAAAANLAELRLTRLAGPPGGADGAREVRVLAEPDGALLMQELDRLREAADAGEPLAVDLVLPPGEYLGPDGRQSLIVGGRGLRLLGQGGRGAVLHFGLSVIRESDVVLEDLRLEPPVGSAVSVDRASVLLRGCELVASALAVQVTDGSVELERSVLVPLAGSGQLAGGLRFGRLALLLARDSRIAAQQGAISGARTVYLERCVVDGGERDGVEGRMDGEVLLLDSYVRGDAGALASVQAGAIEGAVLSGAAEAARNCGGRLVVCPQHALHVGPLGAFGELRRADRCLLGR